MWLKIFIDILWIAPTSRKRPPGSKFVNNLHELAPKKNIFKKIVVSHIKTRLQMDYTIFIKVPIKFIIFVKIIHENSLVVLIKLYLRHLFS